MGGDVGDREQLGRELSDSRTERRESLKVVAAAAGVSATYLQKLERGQVDTPSPRILRALSGHLGLSYRRLMELAGYEVPAASPSTAGVLTRTLASAKLSQSEERAVLAFVDLLVNQRDGSKPRRR